MITTLNMGLILPDVGSTIGPLWASTLNQAFEDIDAHDHTSNNGKKITPTAIDINSNLNFYGNGIDNAGYCLLATIAALDTTKAASIQRLSGDLYWVNESGIPVQITNGGSLAGTSGSIGGLTSPASASYDVASTSFFWKSNGTTLAGMNVGTVVFRQAALSASANSISISAPSSGVSPYSLVLPPAAPATVGRFLFASTAGAMSWVQPDASTIEVSGADLRVKTGGIIGNKSAYGGAPTGQIALGTITGQTSPNNSVATVLGNIGLGTITGGSTLIGFSWNAVGNIALGTIVGGIAGVSSPSGNIAYRTIATENIEELAITTAKLNSLAVTTAKLDSLAVTTAKLANGAATSAKVGSDLVNANISASANINGSKLLDQSITHAKITKRFYFNNYEDSNMGVLLSKDIASILNVQIDDGVVTLCVQPSIGTLFEITGYAEYNVQRIRLAFTITGGPSSVNYVYQQNYRLFNLSEINIPPFVVREKLVSGTYSFYLNIQRTSVTAVYAAWTGGAFIVSQG